jgi:hypothetical protein
VSPVNSQPSFSRTYLEMHLIFSPLLPKLWTIYTMKSHLTKSFPSLLHGYERSAKSYKDGSSYLGLYNKIIACMNNVYAFHYADTYECNMFSSILRFTPHCLQPWSWTIYFVNTSNLLYVFSGLQLSTSPSPKCVHLD